MAVDSRSAVSPLDACSGDGFARGDDAELSKAVEQPDFLLVEIARGRVIPNLGAIREAEQRRVDGLQRRDAGASRLQRLPKFAGVVTDRGNDPDSGDGDSTRHCQALGQTRTGA